MHYKSVNIYEIRGKNMKKHDKPGLLNGQTLIIHYVQQRNKKSKISYQLYHLKCDNMAGNLYALMCKIIRKGDYLLLKGLNTVPDQ